MGDHGEAGHGAGRCEVCVVEHDERRLAAEFEEDALEAVGSCRHHLLAGRGGAGERDDVDAGIARKYRSHRVIARGDDVDHTGRDVGFLGDDLADQRRAPRGVGGGLEDHRATGGQRGADLREVDLVREIPRCDGADHTGGLTLHAPLGLDTHRFGPTEVAFPFVTLGEVGQPAQIIDRALELRA